MVSFDGVTVPRVVVELATGGTTTVDPPQGYFVLGTSLLDTGVLGGLSWADVSIDATSITINRGQAGPFEAASPGTMTLVLDNASGAYDPTVVNLLSANQSDLELGATTGWAAKANCTVGVTSAAAQHGTWSLTLTSSAGGAMTATTPAGTAGVGVTGGLPYTAIASFQAAASARTVRCWTEWYSAAGTLISTSSADVTPTDATTGWAQASTADAAPAGAAYAAVVVGVDATGGASEVHRVDEVGLMQGSTTVWRPGGTVGVLDVGVGVRAKAVWQGQNYPLYAGVVTRIVPDVGFTPTVTLECADGLEALGRAFLGLIGASFDGDTTGTRLGRILDGAGWTAPRNLDTGLSTCQATTYDDYALPLAQAVVDTELGMQFVDGAGTYTFFDRLHVYTAPHSTTVQATLSDLGSDVDVLTLTLAKDAAQVFNEARVTRTGGAEQVASDAGSQLAYGRRTFPGSVGTLARTDADALSLASWIVGRHKLPTTQVLQVDLDAYAQGMWAALLPLAPLDRVRVLRTYGPVTVDVQVLLEGWQLTIGLDSWAYSFSTRNVDAFTPFVLGTSLLSTGTIA